MKRNTHTTRAECALRYCEVERVGNSDAGKVDREQPATHQR